MEDQLREIAETLRFDFLLISNSDGAPLAGVVRIDDQFVAMDISRMKPPQQGFFTLGGNTYQVNSFPIDINRENIGVLSIGERFDLSDFEHAHRSRAERQSPALQRSASLAGGTGSGAANAAASKPNAKPGSPAKPI